MFALVASMIPEVLADRSPECVLFRILPGIELAFRVDAFGLLFAAGTSVLWILTSCYSIGYMRSLKERAQTSASLAGFTTVFPVSAPQLCRH